jgi:D-alanine transaminase
MIVYLNGEYLPVEQAKISPEDRGFLFADAIYEVARFNRGRGYRLAEHMARMRNGLAAIRIAADPGFFPEVAARLLAENGLASSDAIVYAQVSRGAAPRTHAFPPEGTAPTTFAFARAVEPEAPDEGGGAILVPDERWGRCDIKTVMLLPNVLAAQRAAEAGAFEAILVRDGVVTEATRSNVLAVAGGVVRTHPTGPLILPGVTREVVLELASGAGIPVREEEFGADELFAAEEVLLTGTTADVTPVVTVDGRAVGEGGPGPVGRRLGALLAERIGVAPGVP